MDIDRFMEETRDAILDHGFTVQYADGRSLAFQHLPRAHTVGRTLFGRPEVLISGPFTQEQMLAMLTELVTIDQNTPLKINQIVEAEGRSFRVEKADPSALVGALAAFGSIQAFQLVWLDAGASPGQPQALRLEGAPHPLHPTTDPYGPQDPFEEDE